jgi:hypothetical protein
MMPSMAEEPQSVSLAVSWAPLDEVPVEAANAFLVQLTQGPSGRPAEFMLGIGVLSPPAIFGPPPEEVLAQLRRRGEVPIRPVARVMFTRDRAIELRDALDQVLRVWDELDPQQS